MKKIILQVVGTLFATFGALWVQADELNLRAGVTEISQDVYNLHMLILWICVAIGVVVFGVLFYSVYAHRKSRGVEPAQFHHSTKLEIAWTIVPTLILVGMAYPATESLIKMYDTGGEDMTVGNTHVFLRESISQSIMNKGINKDIIP